MQNFKIKKNILKNLYFISFYKKKVNIILRNKKYGKNKKSLTLTLNYITLFFPY